MPERVSVRCTRVNSKIGQRYRLPPNEASKLVGNLLLQGFRPEEIYLDESAPDQCVTFQCEVMNSWRNYDIRYSLNSGMGMRQAYETMEHANGLEARMLLRRFLDAPSLDKVDELLYEYPNDILELSAYSCPVGVLLWNTIFWECRGY